MSRPRRLLQGLAATLAAAAVQGAGRSSALARTRALSASGVSASAASPAALDPEQWLAMQRRLPVPVTIISGFLGAGKTTLLKHVLENGEGYRVGVLVNDVAAVNIDAKLVAQRGSAGPAVATAAGAPPAAAARASSPVEMDMVQLQNGCICCNAGDEMFGALGELISLSYMKGSRYDHVLVESSGVAEPRLVRDAFQEAEAAGFQVMQAVRLARMVTVVDASTFAEQLNSLQKLRERPELLETAADGAAKPLAPFAAAAAEDPAANRAIVDLLVEQVETADVVVLNKLDCVSEEQAALVRALVSELNGYAQLVDARFGKVELGAVLPAGYSQAEVEAGAPLPESVAQSNEVMDHKAAVDLAAFKAKDSQKAAEAAPAGAADGACEEGEHGGAHSHAHGHAHVEHAHEPSGAPAAAGPAHGEPGHVCAADDCGHDHSHGAAHAHSHGADEAGVGTTAAARFGIRTFVYARRRPFDGAKVRSLFAELTAVQAEQAAAGQMPDAGAAPQPGASARTRLWSGVLRSKGFVWLEESCVAAHYWSHARVHGELGELGQWWAAVPQDAWPHEYLDSILADFEPASKAAALRQLEAGAGASGQATAVGVGDRRQELVFIGVGLDEAAISAALDCCLVDVPAELGAA